MHRLSTFIVICGLILFAGTNVLAMPTTTTNAQPVLSQVQLAINAAVQPAYTLSSNCAAGHTAITFHLSVSNIGSISSPANSDVHSVWVQDAAIASWAGGAALPALPPKASAQIDVALAALNPPSGMSGRHVFNATVGGAKTSIAVVVPSGFCSGSAAVSLVQPAGVAHAMPTPTKNPTLQANPIAQLAAGPIPAPKNLVYTNSPQVCAAHIPGLGAALVCPGIIASAVTLPLVWDWMACTQTGCLQQIDGYHIYRVTTYTGDPRRIASLGMGQPVDTQPDPTITIRGISPYNKTDCFVVTAFKGSVESPASNKWCGASNLAMGEVTLQLQPTVLQTRYSHDLTPCAPTSITQIETPQIDEGVTLLGSPSEPHDQCYTTRIIRGYAGFTFNAHGSVQKATLHVAFDGSCGITGVAKTINAGWFASGPSLNPQVMLAPNSSGTPGFIAEDPSSQRSFEFSSSVFEGEIMHDATADITGWFPPGGSTTFGLGFVKVKSAIPCWANMWPIWVEIVYYPSS